MLVYIELIILITLILTLFIALNIFLLLESSLVEKKRLILQLKGKKKIYLNALTDLVFDINDTFRKKKSKKESIIIVMS